MMPRTPLSLLALGLALAAPAQAARSFCCTLDNGTRACGDILPEACRSRSYTEFNEQGNKVRNVEAPLTPAQQAARDVQLKKQREAEQQALEQKRRDSALLATYATEKELDQARDRLVTELERGIQDSKGKLDDAIKEQTKLAKDAEFYRNKPLPADLKVAQRRNQQALEAERNSIENKKKEIEQVAARFEADRKRLRELRTPKQD
ncbi:hypothetical protein B9N43_11015 [Denitratisoma sp. DHT3]|uniref:hypothetical protein n=1 Tax=Denitratisoma sp. DHT3 TaxID=1981880 RepID=UPI0011989F51|nr:hypothetical protein [Denitratisoma sp. DHT3]QDX81737.1 hypothetical protein B9N43_11015 [Denitratisoma sp. DHT3]